MAINSFVVLSDNVPPKSLHSAKTSRGEMPCRSLNAEFSTDESITNSVNKRLRLKKNNESKSPYLTGDKVQMHSRVMEKRLLHKKTTDFVSSFPLATNIYKANSDEFKTQKKANKKNKKSVLTLPNEPVPAPEECTVSDLNDTEYCNQKTKSKKRLPIQNRKSRNRNKFEFYDRDAQYCSQMNIDLDCSSTDILRTYNGDGSKVRNKPFLQKTETHEFNAHDMWAVLRNINKFQFRPSPPMSDDSVVSVKKKKGKRKNNHKNTRLIETCRTEEFAYISTFDVGNKSPTSYSQSSSFDRITVIDKKDEFTELCKEFENKLTHLKPIKTKKIKNKSSKSSPYMRSNTKNNLCSNAQENFKPEIHCFPNKIQKNCSPLLGSHNSKSNGNLDTVIAINDVVNSDKVSFCKDEKNEIINVPESNLDDNIDNIIHSGLSEGSQTELNNRSNGINKPIKLTLEESSHQLKGITKVVLSKGQEIVLSKKIESQNKKPRPVPKIPNPTVTPKLTLTDIRRRLANIRFPLVILGKDQLSSTVQIVEDDSPQFYGIEDHIWPFMTEWSNTNADNGDTNNKTNLISTENTHKIKRNGFMERNGGNMKKSNNGVFVHNNISSKDKKGNIDSISSKKRIDEKHIPNIHNINPQTLKKPKPITQFKDKMLKFLYRKPQNNDNLDSVSEDKQTNRIVYNNASNKKDVNVGTDTKDLYKKSIESPSFNDKRPQIIKYPWSKAKWASDFIDNVIKKIKNGVYYNLEHRDHITLTMNNSYKDASIQTNLIFESNRILNNGFDLCNQQIDSHLTINKKSEALPTIPGFDHSLTALEIKSMSKNQIAVKHCLTNVMVQFDVSVPTDTNRELINIETSSCILPIAEINSQTKIFKCKTTILNAVLPAELCSILPKMMRDIMDSSTKLGLPSLPIDSHLSTITEIANYENITHIKVPLPQRNVPLVRRETKILQNGAFCMKISPLNDHKEAIKILDFDQALAKNLLPSLDKVLFIGKICSIMRIYNILEDKPVPQIQVEDDGGIIPECKALQLYVPPNKTISSTFKNSTYINLLEQMLTLPDLKIDFVLPINKLHIQDASVTDDITVNMYIENCNDIQKNVTVSVNKLKIDSLYNGSSKKNCLEYKVASLIEADTFPFKNTHEVDQSKTHKMEKKNSSQNVTVNNNKLRKKSFVKLYKKCKSTSNISSEKGSASLNKITNLDEFLQSLGSGKLLSSVFDGNPGKKIMSSLIELKSWITEISPRQALLVLLLTNKKDTANLVRFRPILLQGIAVNRITRATELDMEIEVIERENMSKLSQYEGISYLPTSVENHDKLLEELYWIAKTTASDYQRPFDESSEKLLKSLLEKRKKLNPSYLRVMARYVGLGLLKTPYKK